MGPRLQKIEKPGRKRQVPFKPPMQETTARIAEDPAKFRASMREAFLRKYELTEKQSTNLEIGAYNFALKEADNRKIIKKWENRNFCQIYLDRLRSLYRNLPELAPRIRAGEYEPQQVAFMSHFEMNPSCWQALIQQKMKRDAQTATTMQASTDMFMCRACKSRKYVYYELQTRSADEPSTIFITCLDCGKNWKQ